MSGDIGKSLDRAILEAASKAIRDRLGSIRHPETGEFPTVVIRGDSISDLRAEVEGSPELLALLREQLSPEDLAGMTLKDNSPAQSPRVFLSYAGEDRELAKTIALKLVESGIDTWWAEWEINAGDSLRQKIDEGLANCTHFLVLLSPSALGKPWVNQEIDAGLVRRLQMHCRFIPLRRNLPVDKLPALLSGMLSPEVNEEATNLGQLVHEILGVSRKPKLGDVPPVAQLPKTGYTAAATAIAKICVHKASNGETGEVQYSVEQFAEDSGLSMEDVVDALHELRAFFIKTSLSYMAKANLYAEFDGHFTDHSPKDDAFTLAAWFVNEDDFPNSPDKIAERLSWPPRRLNAAVTYLMERDAVRGTTALSTGPFVVYKLSRSDSTRRFVKSRS